MHDPLQIELLYRVVVYCILLYDFYTEVYNNTKTQVQISCVIVHFETRLSQLLKQAAGIVVFISVSNYFVLKYWRQKGRNISNFNYLIPDFNLDFQPEL